MIPSCDKLRRRARRGVTLLELMVVCSIIALLAGLIALPSYRAYAAARAATDAARTLAADLALLERLAKNGPRERGACLILVSADPLHYRGYLGRPASIDPNSALGALIVERSYAGVSLVSGPIDAATPLLFAGNGSVQYLSGGEVAGQHATIAMALARSPRDRAATVELDLFTGAVSAP